MSQDIIHIFKNEIKEERILFVSDIEDFSEENKNELEKRVTEKKAQLVVFIGDILSFLSVESPYYKIYRSALTVFKMFYDADEVLKKLKAEPDEIYPISENIIGNKISEEIEKEYSDQLNNFFEFISFCRKKKVEILYYSGNHDSMLAYQICHFISDIPVLEKLSKRNNFHIVPSLQPVFLNENLSIIGVHTDKDDLEGPKYYDDIKQIINSLKLIEQPEKIIFVSHVPGTLKFSKIGSQDITNLKKRYKFKYHYHGHCKNYHGTYLEEGVPTLSVHWDFHSENSE